MYRVLFADDEPIMRIAFRKMLEAGSDRFSLAATVANGMEALAYIAEHSVDMVVTDLKMPVMDGLELIERLGSSGFSGPILVLSNYNDFELVRTALTRGACDYLLKQSIDAEKLLRQLDAMAERIGSGGNMAPAPQGSGAPRDIQDAYAHGGVFCPCLLTIRPRSEEAPPPPMERVLAVLEQVLGDACRFISTMGEDKALLLFAQETPADGRSRMEDKLRQAVRGIRTYLNLPADVLVAPPARSPEQARRYCDECIRLSESPSKPDAPPVQAMEEALFADIPGYSTYQAEVREALLFIHLHFAEKISLDDVASAVNLNPSYLCRLFKQETGETMFRHLNTLRMRKAACLIEEGCTYMRGVAADVGIDDQFYFARVFRKHYGVSPSEYGRTRRE